MITEKRFAQKVRKTFDILIANHVIEHIAEPLSGFSKLTPIGHLFLAFAIVVTHSTIYVPNQPSVTCFGPTRRTWYGPHVGRCSTRCSITAPSEPSRFGLET